MQAADFLDDQETVTGLLKKVSHQLFERFINTGENTIDEDLARV